MSSSKASRLPYTGRVGRRLSSKPSFNRDYPVIQAYVLLVGVLFVFFNLFFDILQYVADPRLRERKA